MRGDERVDRSSVTERDVDTARELPVAQDRSPLARQAHHVFARELAEAIVAATVVPSRIERGWSNRTRRRDGGGSLRIGLSPDGPRRGGDTSTTATSPVFPSATVRMSLTKTRWLRTISTASAIVLAYWRIARTTSVVGVRGQSLVAALSVTPIFVRSCRSGAGHPAQAMLANAYPMSGRTRRTTLCASMHRRLRSRRHAINVCRRVSRRPKRRRRYASRLSTSACPMSWIA